jgi:hypothetical protein
VREYASEAYVPDKPLTEKRLVASTAVRRGLPELTCRRTASLGGRQASGPAGRLPRVARRLPAPGQAPPAARHAPKALDRQRSWCGLRWPRRSEAVNCPALWRILGYGERPPAAPALMILYRACRYSSSTARVAVEALKASPPSLVAPRTRRSTMGSRCQSPTRDLAAGRRLAVSTCRKMPGTAQVGSDVQGRGSPLS